MIRKDTLCLWLVRARINKILEEEVARAKEYAAIKSIDTEPVVSANVQNATPEPEPAPALAPTVSTEQAQELVALRGELAAQEVLRRNEREQKKTVEEQRRMEENLRKSQANNDRLKEEREKLLKDKDNIRWQAETGIEWLKEELQQQKHREDRMRSQINWRLRQKTDYFNNLCREHKQTDVEYKWLGSKVDR